MFERWPPWRKIVRGASSLATRQSDPSALARQRDGSDEPVISEREMLDLLTSVRAALPAAPGQYTIGVMSVHANEGVSSVASALASAAASNNWVRVLLCSVTTGSAVSVGASPLMHMESLPGPLRGTLTIGQVAGQSLAQAVVSQPGSAKALVRSLAQAFDLAVVELPSFSGSSLGPTLSRGLDGVVLVIEAERTRARAVDELRRSIEKQGGTVLGAVLNKRREHLPGTLSRWL
jgi:protein-tyrosine kinase